MIVNATVSFPDNSKFILIDDFFEESDIADINQLFYSNIGWQRNTNFSHGPERMVYSGTSTVLEKIKKHAQLVDISSVLGTPVEFSGIDLWKDTGTYKISPHYDMLGIDYAVQIYMGETDNTFQMLGTTLYTATNQPLLEISYRPNSGYLIDAPHTVLHGLRGFNDEISVNYMRYSVYLRYRKK